MVDGQGVRPIVDGERPGSSGKYPLVDNGRVRFCRV